MVFEPLQCKCMLNLKKKTFTEYSYGITIVYLIYGGFDKSIKVSTNK